jgi:hypothetical protein
MPLRYPENRWRKSLTQEQHTEEMDTTDESTEDSPVIKALRKQVADLTKAAKSAPSRDSVEAEIREELARESAISEQLVALGHPAGMSAILKGTLGDAEVTRESVAEALQGIGYQVEVDETAEQSDDPESSSQAADLAKVTGLSAQVRSAANGLDPNASLSKDIAGAKTPAELNAVMEKAGLTAKYT